MQVEIFIAVLFFGTCCFSQDDYIRPEFPDVFQTEIQGTFIKEKEVVEIDGDLYYDRDNNRAAYQLTMNGETTTSIYNFNSNEVIAIDGNECVVNQISDNPMESFFPFTLDEQKRKKILGPDEILYFSKSELNRQELSIIPTLIFTATIDIPAYGRKNCQVTHVFTKPDIELPTCKQDQLCESTLLTISVKCKDEKGNILVDHVYNFFRFTSGIADESIFLPPVGVYCDMKSSKPYPAFPSYYSFAFDVVENIKESDAERTLFSTHREFYFEEENKIIRIDEFDGNGLLASSRVFDLQAGTTFMIVPVVNKCFVLSFSEKIDFAEISRLPKMFFQNNSPKDTSVFVGKRTLNGITYEVWSYQWTDAHSEAKVVEEVYFLEVTPELTGVNDTNEPFLQISHADTYTYEIQDESRTYDLTLLRRIMMNNYRTRPKEFSAFDVQTCFNHSQRRDFYMKANAIEMVKESQAYGEIIEHLYNKITSVVGITILRISELTGDFDGTELIGIKGSILEVTSESGWEKSKQPGMDETFERMKTAASQGKLSVTFKKEYSQESTFTVLSIEDPLKPEGNYTRPEFPDVFQTEIQSIFIKDKEVVKIDGNLYYDRDNNRAAYQKTINGETTTRIYNFNSNEVIVIDGNECVVNQISDNPMDSLFLFTLDEQKKKKILGPDEILYFSKSELYRHEVSIFPTLIFTGTIDIPAYGKQNCQVMHVFTKPDIELPTCKEDQCRSTLLTISVKCKDERGNILVDHMYNFFRFTSGIADASIFLPPVGVHCDMNSSKSYPAFPSYYSFTFDVVEEMKESDNISTVFVTHREFYFEEENEIVRIDEFDGNGLLASSRVYDLQAATTFMIVPVVNKCYVLPFLEKIDFAKISRLPKMFFQNNSSNDSSVYIGKREINELSYEVWSNTWTNKESGAKVVEEVYFLEVTPELKGVNDTNEPFLQISHADTYTYEIKDESMTYDVTLLRRIIMNNYRTNPKEFSAFDVQTCFNHNQRRDFYMKVNATDMVKESQAFGEIIEHLYNKITSVVGVSILRISELTGDFDGAELIGIKGSILEVTSESGWEKNKQPGMDETFERMKTAASQGKLSVTFKKEYAQESTFAVLSVEDPLKPQEAKKPDCYSGGSMAAVSLVLLLIGMFFGIAGYYVFLKKRKSPTNDLLMQSVKLTD